MEFTDDSTHHDVTERNISSFNPADLVALVDMIEQEEITAVVRSAITSDSQNLARLQEIRSRAADVRAQLATSPPGAAAVASVPAASTSALAQ